MTIDVGTPYVAPGSPWATIDDVKNALGALRDRLPSWVVIGDYLSVAHAELIDELSRVYPDGLPVFTGPGALVIRYAEAKIAAALILEAIRVNLPDLGDAPERLRVSALRSVQDGVAGYPPGATTVPGDPTPSSPGPRVSSFTPMSAFPDPYADARSYAGDLSPARFL